MGLLERSYAAIEDDDKLKEDLKKVFESLPPLVQDELDELVTCVTACCASDTQLKNDQNEADTRMVNDAFPYDGKYIIRIKRGIATSEERIYIVAHELAHAYLRHPTYLVRLRHLPISLSDDPKVREELHELRMQIYDKVSGDPRAADGLKQLCDKIEELLEDDADLKVCQWGFKSQLVAFHAKNNRRKPEFYELDFIVRLQ